MKNVYDIILNFKNEAYEFYEWNKEDEINHINKIPSYKVDDKTLFEVLNYNVIIKDEFLKEIYNKTDLFSKKKIKYSALLFNNKLVLGILIDDNGFVIKKSKLLFDEEEDVIKTGEDLPLYKLNYTIYKKKNINKNYTRYENNTIKLLNNYIDSLNSKKCYDELKYIYLECFNKKEEDINKIYLNLKEKINFYDKKVINNLKDLFKVLKN